VKRKRKRTYGESPFARSIREMAAAMEAEGYTVQTLQNMEPSERDALIDRHINALPGMDEVMWGTGRQIR